MAHVVTTPHPPFAIAGGRLEVVQVPSATDNLVWLVVDRAAGDVVIVDGPEAGGALAWIDGQGLTLAAVWITHVHGDHIGVLRDLARRGRFDGVEVVGPAARADEVPGLTRAVDEGDRVALGGASFAVWRVEGHQHGHVAYVGDGAVFCGDTMFAGGCGYLFDGPPEAMFASLMRLASLPGDTRVCCAHEYTQDNLRFAWHVEPDNTALAERIQRVWAVRSDGGCAVPSTIAEEQATNPFLRPGSPSLQARVAAGLPDRPLATPADVFAATRALKDVKPHAGVGDEVLPLG